MTLSSATNPAMVISRRADDFGAGLALLAGEETIVARGGVIGAAVSGGAAGGTSAGRGAGATAAPGAAACRAAVVDVVGGLGLALVAGAGVEDAGCD